MAKSPTVTFGAVGDVAFDCAVSRQMREHGADWPFARMKPFLEQADLLFGNMESPSIPADFPPEQIDPRGLITGIPGPEAAAALKRAGFDFLNMAANHLLDAGSIGMDFTRSCLHDVGIVTGGVGWSQEEARQLKIIEKNGICFGFLCYAEDSNWLIGHTHPGYAFYEPETIIQDVRTHRDEVDVLVVSIHADIEFSPTPAVPRRDHSRAIARAGADILLEHHPHVPQGIEMVDGCLIAYSLGNFVFGVHSDGYLSKHLPRTADSHLLLMQVGKEGVRSFERIPLRIAAPPEERPCPLEGADRDVMLAYFDELDRLLQDDAFVRKTWRETSRRFFWSLLQRATKGTVDSVIQEDIGRACLVAENRACFEEVLAEAREHWEAQKKLEDPYHRPNFHFQKPS